MEDGEGREIFFVEAKGLVALELFVFFPSWGLKKMLIHKGIIAYLGGVEVWRGAKCEKY